MSDEAPAQHHLLEEAAEKAASRLRGVMPIIDHYAYLDHAAVAPLPQPAAIALSRYAEQVCRHGDTVWLEWATEISQLRDSAAALIRAKPEEIALIPNTTYGIHLVADGFPWQAGDNVVVPDNEFPSNMLPWLQLKSRGVEVRRIEVPPDGIITPEQVDARIDSRTRVVAISWVGFSSGFRIDLEAIVELAHRRECLVMLDAIQGLGAFPLDVRATPIDFLAADGHKWMLGPEGAGIFYCRQEHLERMRPIGSGWNSLATGGFDPGSSQLKTTAARYEGGTWPVPGLLALHASLQLLRDLGAGEHPSPLAAAILQRCERLARELEAAGFHCPQYTRPENRSGILGITWPEADADPERLYPAARKFLMQRGVVTSVRGERLRVAVHAYNNTEDCQRLIEGLVAFRQQNAYFERPT